MDWRAVLRRSRNAVSALAERRYRSRSKAARRFRTGCERAQPQIRGVDEEDISREVSLWHSGLRPMGCGLRTRGDSKRKRRRESTCGSGIPRQRRRHFPDYRALIARLLLGTQGRDDSEQDGGLALGGGVAA